MRKTQVPISRLLFSLTAHRRWASQLMLCVTWALFVYTLGLAFWFDSELVVVVLGFLLALIPSLLFWKWPDGLLSRVCFAVGFMLQTATHVHQAKGMIEVHFGFFVLLAFLLFYRDWLPIALAAAVAAVQHLTFHYLQMNGYPVYIFEDGAGLEMVVMHGCYVGFEATLLCVMAHRLRLEALQSEDVCAYTGNLLRGEGKIDLKPPEHTPSSAVGRALQQIMTQTHRVLVETGDVAERLSEAEASINRLTAEHAEKSSLQVRETSLAEEAVHRAAEAAQTVSRNTGEAAESTQEVDRASQEGATTLEQGQSVVQQLAQGVDETSEIVKTVVTESDRIGSVLDIIAGIAEQTNLLALNAAIEAARAGENGRGFAVVADEVRTLASRTQESSKDVQEAIGCLRDATHRADAAIGSSREQMSNARKTFDAIQSQLQSIASGVQKLTSLNRQTAELSESQTQEMNKGEESVNKLRQEISESDQNARTLAESAGDIAALATELKNKVRQFAL